jgi:hypothetical protein
MDCAIILYICAAPRAPSFPHKQHKRRHAQASALRVGKELRARRDAEVIRRGCCVVVVVVWLRGCCVASSL